MKKHLAVLVLLMLLFFAGCKSDKKGDTTPLDIEPKPDMHTSQIAIDLVGSYEGILPCADCEGIKSTILLNEDMTYKSTSNYMGKDGMVFTTQGQYKWQEGGETIILLGDDPTTYKVGENQLTHLDKSGKHVTGDLAHLYILKKQTDSNHTSIGFTDTKWMLVKLFGKDIKNSDAFISFNTSEYMVFGNTGCNNFNGNYTIENENQVTLSQVATTMMSCPDMSIEKAFMEVLNTTDNYSLNGNTMTLNKAKMAPLAVFEAIE
ncbi:copper resistance protein NlpE N-terminal domain-containing protein [Mariniflexile ostreae]|uniref:Copper resistance protein NlpE N-terminal domain-containing protein n=1 Tax=Mariniflexile ostreae TaxID=1520892 RepID=A0ABV5F7Y6_9FLAO